MWRKVSVDQYQSIHSVLGSKSNDVDKLFRIVSILYNITEQSANNLPLKTFQKHANQAAAMIEKPIAGKPKRFIGLRKVLGNIPAISLGQYIDVQFLIANGQIENLHSLAVVITSPIFGKDKEIDHEKMAARFKDKPFLTVYATVSKFLTDLGKFQKRYTGLFGKGEEGEVPDPFLKNYGWFYSAKRIADYKSIPLDEALKMPLKEAFNMMVYLKDLQTFEDHQLKKIREKPVTS